MVDVRQTEAFTRWLGGLKDQVGKARIASRLRRLAHDGLYGDVKYFAGIGEMRVDHGPGYRLYFTKRGETLVFLLCGGDKSTQSRDIERAKQMAKEL